jgi:hypothetical protein
MASLDWLHISDLHIRGGDRRSWTQDAVLAALVRDAPALMRELGIAPRLVFVTGDITASGKPAEFTAAESCLRALAQGLNVKPEDSFSLVPGNHDVDQTAIDRLVELAQRTIFGLSQQEFGDHCGGLLGDSAMFSRFGARLAAYCEFTAQLLGSRRAVTTERPYRSDSFEFDGLKVRIASLCSAWMCRPHEDQQGRIVLGPSQLDQVMADDDGAQLTFAGLHHPLAWLHQHEALLVRNRVRRMTSVVLHGHTHQEENYARIDDQHLVVCGAGAAYADPRDGHSHGFQAATFDPGDERLMVYSFRYDPDEGRWYHRPTGAHPRQDGGVSLPLPLRRTGSASANRTLSNVDRLLQARPPNQQVSFVGFPTHAPRQATLDELFVTREFEDRRARDDQSPTLPLEQVEHRLLGTTQEAGRFVVLGDPGAGKTTLCQHLLSLAPKRRRVPLLLSVSDLRQRDSSAPLVEFLAEQASRAFSIPVSQGMLVELFTEGTAVLLVDGLDEERYREPTRRIRLHLELDEIARNFRALPILVTSRHVGYEDARLDRSLFHELRLCPFSDVALQDFVRRWYGAVGRPELARERAVAFLAALEADQALKDLARAPLLCLVMALLFQHEKVLPAHRSHLFNKCISALMRTWPQASGRTFPVKDFDYERRQVVVIERLALKLQESDDLRRGGELNVTRRVMEEITAEIVGELDQTGGWGWGTRACEEISEQWVNWLTADVGLLVEHGPDALSFVHPCLMELLAGTALLQRERKRGDEGVVDFVRRHHRQPHWFETLLLMLAKNTVHYPELAGQVVSGLVEEAEREQDAVPRMATWTFLLAVLREDIDLSEQLRARILDGAAATVMDVGESHVEIAMRWLNQVIQFSQRHGVAVRKWFEATHRSGRGSLLSGAAVLTTGDESDHAIGILSARPDTAAVAGELLEIWPRHAIGTWAARTAGPQDALEWAMNQDVRVTVGRAMGCLAESADALVAEAQILALFRRAEWLAAVAPMPGAAGDRREWRGPGVRACPANAPAFQVRWLSRTDAGATTEYALENARTFASSFAEDEIIPRLSGSMERALLRCLLRDFSALIRNFLDDEFGNEKQELLLLRYFLADVWPCFGGDSFGEDYLEEASRFVDANLRVTSTDPRASPTDWSELWKACSRTARGGSFPILLALATEAYEALRFVKSAPDGERIANVTLPLRFQNVGLNLFFDWLFPPERMMRDLDVALLLALSVMQFQTTRQWPRGRLWKQLLTRAPSGGWPCRAFMALIDYLSSPGTSVSTSASKLAGGASEGGLLAEALGRCTIEI